MKSTESLDDAGKSVDLASATGETTVSSETSSPENKRRRLVRGAVAFAPLVLTLRSGALAAATSCTSVKRLAKVDSSNGKLLNFDNTKVTGLITTGTNPDVCVDIQAVNQCEQVNSSIIRIETKSSYPTAPVVPTNGNYFKCGSAQFKGDQNIAILSATSAHSLVGV